MKKIKYDSGSGIAATANTNLIRSSAVRAGKDCVDNGATNPPIPPTDQVTTGTVTGTGTSGGDVGHVMDLFKAVFTNDLLLRCIFKHFDFQDLKSWRQVNLLCNSEATKVLRRKYVTQPIDLSNSSWFYDDVGDGVWEATCERETTETSIHGPDSSDTMKCGTLQEIVDLVEKSASKTFPCNNFSFLSIQILEVDDFQKLVRLHGEYIRSLYFSLYSNRGIHRFHVKLMENLLAHQLPNLEDLKIDVDEEWDDCDFQLFSELQGTQNTQCVIKRLKTLSIGDILEQYPLPKSLLRNMLKVAVSLETLDVNLSSNLEVNMPIILELNATHLIKYFIFDFKPSIIDLYTKFAKKSQKLEHLDVNLEVSMTPKSFKKAGNILSDCFASNVETLQSIKCFVPFGLFPGWQLPFLPKIIEFEFDGDGDGVMDDDWTSKYSWSESLSSVPIFPIGSTLSEQWPNLNRITIWLGCGNLDSYSITEVFSADLIPHNLVRKLFVAFKEYEEGLPTTWVQYFCNLFPRVTDATFKSLRNFPRACAHIWNLEHLETLDFSVALDSYKVCVFPCIEAGFTGFTEKTCKRLFQNPDESSRLSKEDAKELRVNPSILDLKYLKSVKLHVMCWDDEKLGKPETKDGENAHDDNSSVEAEEPNDVEGREGHEVGKGDICNFKCDGNIGYGDFDWKEKQGEGTIERVEDKNENHKNDEEEGKESESEDDNDDEDNDEDDDEDDDDNDEDDDEVYDEFDDDDDNKVISHVTKLLAFKMCPQLKPEFIEIKVSYDATSSSGSPYTVTDRILDLQLS